MLSFLSGSKKNCRKMRKICWETCQRFRSCIERARLPCIRKVGKGNILTSGEVIELKGVIEDNDLLYLGAALMTKVFKTNKTKREREHYWWKRRLKSQVKELNEDLGRLNALFDGKKMKKKHRDILLKRWKLKERKNKIKRGDISRN